MRLLSTLLFSLFILFQVSAQNPQRTVKSSNEIYLNLLKAAKPSRVLYVAAHPDDENTRVIAWLENHRHIETAYFSFTRGDGGQNLIGSEKGPLLGVLRTQELLQARSKDGGQQFFSHAIDFGYSKSPEETLEIWDEDVVLGDLVYAIRYFKPDVIITRFPPNSQAGHGHHSASAILAERAFALAGDPNQYPEQLSRVKPWSPLRIVWNSYSWRRTKAELEEDVLIQTGQSVPLLGLSTGEIASQARSMHRCQGFGRAWNRGEVNEYFKFTNGAPFSQDLFEGINTSWSRFNGAEKVDKAFADLLSNYDFVHTWKNLARLKKIWEALVACDQNPYKTDAIEQIEKLIIASAQIHVEATSSAKSIVAGDSLKLALEATAFEPLAIELKSITLSSGNEIPVNANIADNRLFEKELTIAIPNEMPLSNPYWLNDDSEFGKYGFTDLKYLEQAEGNAELWARFKVALLGADFRIDIPIYHKRIEPDFGERYEPLPVLAPLTVALDQSLHIGINGQETNLTVNIVNSSQFSHSRTLGITVPKGWSINQNEFEISVPAKSTEKINFTLGLNPEAKPGYLKFYWKNEESPVYQVQTVDYEHIPKQTIQIGANIKLSPINVSTSKGSKIGYIAGAGDDIPEILGSLGYTVFEINEANIDYVDLSSFKTIITGIRAYNTQEWLGKKAEVLWDYAKKGGNVVIQYNTLNFLSNLKAPLAPTKLEIGRSRVTKENAEIKVLEPKHPVLNQPNKIGSEDFNDWVQERGLYFGNTWSEDFTPIFEMNDPGEDPQQGSLLVGSFGKGHISYCGISFFRQLPAGVPGAFRLFVNLVELD